MRCSVCGERATAEETRVYFTGPGGVEDGPFGPVITGNSMSVPFDLCGRPTCREEAVKSALVRLGPRWTRS